MKRDKEKTTLFPPLCSRVPGLASGSCEDSFTSDVDTIHSITYMSNGIPFIWKKSEGHRQVAILVEEGNLKKRDLEWLH